MSDSTRPTTLFINVGHSYAHLFMLLYPTVVLALEGTWGMGFAELLPLGFAGYLLFGVGSLPAGWLGDRWNSAWMMALFFLGTGAASILTGLAVGPWSLAVGLTLMGLFASIYHPIALAWLVGAGDRPGRALGVNGVFGAIGTAGAALIAGVLADLVHWRAAFILPGLVCLVTGCLFALGLWRGRLAMVRTSYRPNEARPGAIDARRGLFLMLGAILFTGLIYQMTSVGMPKIFQARLGASIGYGAIGAGTLVAAVYAVSAIGQIVGGLLADRFDERPLYVASYAVQIGILTLAVATHNLLLIAIVALAVTVQTGTQPIENCLMARYTPDAWRATVYGMKFVLGLGLSALGVPFIALIFALTGSFAGVFWAMVVCSVAAVAVGLALPSVTDRSLAPAIQPAE